jgi:uncharacterized membrane protein YdcZ (DUF606 family)
MLHSCFTPLAYLLVLVGFILRCLIAFHTQQEQKVHFAAVAAEWHCFSGLLASALEFTS